MITISTGEPSTLETYREIAWVLSGDEESEAVKFFDKKIAESPNGAQEVVVADERQMLYLIVSMLKQPEDNHVLD